MSANPSSVSAVEVGRPAVDSLPDALPVGLDASPSSSHGRKSVQLGSSPSSQKSFTETCLFKSLAYGSASGLAIGAHFYRKTKVPVRGVDAGIKLFCATGILSYAFCRREHHKKIAQMKEAVEKMNEIEKQRADARRSSS